MHQSATKPRIYAHVKKGQSWKQYSVCRLLISAGRPYHEEEKLGAALNWVTQNFKRCLIIVGDIAHRHNYVAEGLSPLEAYTVSKEDGNLWLERNKERLQNLDIPYNVIRWERWLKHPDFPHRLEKVNHLFKKNQLFEEAIHGDIDRFIRSHQKNRPLTHEMEKRIRENSICFLLEETAICSLWTEEAEAVDVYPGSEIKAIKLFREKNFPAVLPSLKNRVFARLDFSRQK